MNPTSPKTILIADDQLYMIRLLEMTLKKGGYEVVSCRDGNEALAPAARARERFADHERHRRSLGAHNAIP